MIHPEDILLSKISRDLAPLRSSSSEPVEIALIGGAERKMKSDEILRNAKRVYAYADSDDQSVLLAQATLQSHQIDCDKIVCITELPRAADRAIDRGFETICLNHELAIRIQALRANPSVRATEKAPDRPSNTRKS